MTQPRHTDNSITLPQASTVPEYWPVADAPQPVRPTWVPWPIAVMLAPLFWLMPKRFGPRFAAAGWRAAIIAHLVWTIYGIASLLMVLLTDGRYTLVSWLAGRTPERLGHTLVPVPTLWEILRAPLGLLAIQAANLSNTNFMGVSQVNQLAYAILCWALIELGLLVLAAIMMPFVTTGERTRHLFARTVRLVLWSSTSLVLLALGLQVVAVLGNVSTVAVCLATALYSAWALRLIIRGGSRYVGSVREPQIPQCEACGYSLTGLSIHGTCPECGYAVSHSLPGRRQPSMFSAAHGPLSRLRQFLPTVRCACFHNTFFRDLKTHDRNTAGRFAIWTCTATAAVVVIPCMTGIRLVNDHSATGTAWWTYAAALWGEWIHGSILMTLLVWLLILLVTRNVARTRAAWTCAATATALAIPSIISMRIVDAPSGTWWTRPAALVAAWIYISMLLMLLVGLLALFLTRISRRRMDNYAAGIFYWSVWLLPIAAPWPAAMAVVFWLSEPGHPVGIVAALGLAAVLTSIWMLIKSMLALPRVIRDVRFASS